MIRLITESFQSFPNWLIEYMNKHKRLKYNLANYLNVDLQNCVYTEISNLNEYDNIWNNPNIALIFLINGNNKENKVYLNAKGIDDPYSDETYRHYSRRFLIDHAIHTGFVKINTKPMKTKYIDPRQGGQYKDSSGKWTTTLTTDKSGYTIPDPADKLKKLYEINLDNYAEILEKYYKKINKLKSRVLNIDPESVSNYEQLLDTLEDLTETYTNLIDDVNATIHHYNDLPPEEQTQDKFSQMLNQYYSYNYIAGLCLDLAKELREAE